ncbi:GNAT family N-acetyltransferase [Rubricoccus marinus]|uniref:GNAT family N-acetyltransferase n=1 Tax=Rubricoccus marinus TaxID=716817 RepID=A0A259U030_9BACT|nr:GNAT family N-acetyltransferase [Rubricoccus marinus]OZC03359.1 GNAT family N-acetyltransferase [Rubricoccus marinus]
MQIDASPSSSAGFSLGEVRIERVGISRYAEVQALNRAVFGDDRVIFRLDRTDLTFLVAYHEQTPIGFKVGYGESEPTFYSAKGAILEPYRRRGVARQLLARLMDEARAMDYRRFAYDTFPNKHPGMTVMGLAEGFKVTAAGYNAAYRDYRIRFEKRL